MKKIAILSVLILLILFVFGCGEPKTDEKTGALIIDIGADIPYETSTMVSMGERTPSIQFENKTDVNIFTWYAEFSITDKKKIKSDKVIMQGRQDCFTEPGKTTRKMGLYDGAWNCLSNIKDINTAAEPETLTVWYRYKDDLFKATYDYVSKDTVYETSDEKFEAWDKGKLTKDIPKPDSDNILVTINDDKSYSATVYYKNKKEYDDYIKSLEKEKYKVISNTGDTFYADISDKLTISASLDENHQKYSIVIDKK